MCVVLFWMKQIKNKNPSLTEFAIQTKKATCMHSSRRTKSNIVIIRESCKHPLRQRTVEIVCLLFLRLRQSNGLKNPHSKAECNIINVRTQR